MIDNEQRKQAFTEALRNLCVEHRCSLHVTDDGKPYGMASPILLVEMDSIYDGDELVADFQSFEIEGYINP